MGYDKVKHIREGIILESAKKCVLRKGVLNTTIKDISTEAGISRQTFYKYFDSYDKVLYSIQLDCIQKLISYCIDNVADYDSAIEAVTHMTRNLFDFCEKYPNEVLYISTFDNYTTEKATPDEYVSVYSEKVLQQISLDGLIKKGIADGSIRDDMDIRVMESVIYHTLTGIAERIVSLKDKLNLGLDIDRKVFTDSMVDMFVRFMKK